MIGASSAGLILDTKAVMAGNPIAALANVGAPFVILTPSMMLGAMKRWGGKP